MVDISVEEARKQATAASQNGRETYPSQPLTFGDVNGAMPRAEYANSTSLNFAAKQNFNPNYLDFAGTAPGIDLSEFNQGITSRYPLNQVIETLSGHVIEYNDTPENPRILIKHNTGSGVDMRPDGTILVTSHGQGKVEVNHGGHKLVVTGDGQLYFSGDLTLNIGGDFNLNVGGSFNVQAKDETKTINGPSRDLYFGNKYTSIVGSRQDFMTENYTSAALGYRDEYTKGDHKTAAEGSSTIASKGGMNMSSEVQIIQSSPDINIGAQNISVFGATGNIGGEGVIMHNYNMFSGHSIWAAETVNTKTVTATRTMNAASFHGDLFGTATSALAANVAAADGGGGASQSASTDASFDNTGLNDKATTSVMSEYLNKGGYGIQKVFIDKGDHLKGAYDKTRDTGGVTNRILRTTEVRARMRDPGHRSNQNFANYQVSSGVINPKHINTTPTSVQAVVNPKDVTITGRNPSISAQDPKMRVKADVNRVAPISIDPRFNPQSATEITSKTQLARGISLSQFLYGKGDSGKLDPTLSLEARKQLVRNLLPQANILSRIRDNKDLFKGYNLEVIEGVYIKEPKENITPDGILDLRSQGRAVVYELIGPDGVIDKNKTFDLAVWLSANIRYDKIILDYDEYDPKGQAEDHNVQIIVIMPNISSDFTATFKMETETLFNNKSQGSEFIKIGPKNPKIQQGDVGDGGEDLSDGNQEIEDDPINTTPNTRYTGNPENLSGRFNNFGEFSSYLTTVYAKNTSKNGSSYVYNNQQYWFLTNSAGRVSLVKSYDEYLAASKTINAI
jgi:hypothetical protein